MSSSLSEAAVPPWRHALMRFIESAVVRNSITGLIIVNAIVLGMETSEQVRAAIGPALTFFNKLVLAVFVVELAIKLTVYRLQFFRSGWNIFDFIIVGISLAPTSGPLAILRSLRILRVLRLLSSVRRLRMLVESLMQALPGIGWTAALLVMMFYIFGVMGTELFGSSFPQWFGSLGASIYTLFQIMTLESWSMGIARPVIEVYPFAWVFFVPFILISSFMVLNLFIAIIVSATQEVHETEQRAERDAINLAAKNERHEMLALIRQMSDRLESMEQQLNRQRD